MQTPELVVLVAGVVAALRKQLPKLDGAWVYLLVLAASALVCGAVLYAPQLGALGVILRVALEAIAGVSLVGYGVEKMRPKFDTGTFTELRTTDPGAGERGFARLWVLFAVAGLGLAIPIGCAAMKPVTKTVLDAARLACEVWAGEEAGRAGIRAEDAVHAFCTTEEQLRPWLTPLLAANRTASERAGLTRPPAADAGAEQ